MTEQGATEERDTRNIVERMAAVMSEIEHVGKTGQNREQHYNFRPIDEFMNALHGPMSKHAVVVTPRVLDRQVSERARRNGGTTRVVDMLVEFVFTAPDMSSLTVVTAGEGADVADKATNKAMAAALKYAIMQTFLVPTRELNDADATTPDVPSREESQRNAAEHAAAVAVPPRDEIMSKLDEACEALGQTRAALTKKWRDANGIGAIAELDDETKVSDAVLYRYVVSLQPYVAAARARAAEAAKSEDAAVEQAQGVLCVATDGDRKCTRAAGHDGEHTWW